MLKVTRAAMLFLTLSASVYAGDMQNGLQPTPTPSMVTTTRTFEEPTEVFVVDAQQSPMTTAEITLNLVQIVLALF